MAQKILVETTSNIMLVDPMTKDEIAYNRPSVVNMSTFIDIRLGLRQLRMVLAELKDEVTDEDFVAVLKASDGKVDLAIAAFAAEFAPDPKVGEKGPVEPVVQTADQILPPLKAKEK